MATSYPSSLDTSSEQPSPGSTTDLDATGFEHDVVHGNHSGALIALETKLGVGSADASSASDGDVMTKQADGSTAWEAAPADSSKMPLTGGTFTGAVTFDGASPIVLEGATADAYETTIAVTDPTADRTITLPDATGTVALSGDVLALSGGTLTGALTGTDATFTGTTTTYLSLNSQTGTAYTLVAGDSGQVVEMNNASANTLTVPPNSSVAFSVGTQILVMQQGAGATTIAAGAGVTLRSKDSALGVDGQYASVALIKRATDEWYVTGALV